MDHVQLFAEKMYSDGISEFYESCASSTISNAISSFVSMGVLRKGNPDVIQLGHDYQSQQDVEAFLEQIIFFRKGHLGALSSGNSDASKIAKFPMLAKKFGRSNL